MGNCGSAKPSDINNDIYIYIRVSSVQVNSHMHVHVNCVFNRQFWFSIDFFAWGDGCVHVHMLFWSFGE